MFVSPNQAATMLNDFMLGAVMQQDPFLEQFGELPDEPPDDDPCWDAMPIGDDGDDKADTTIVSTENPATIQPPQHMEQGTLFDLPATEPSTPTAIHPTPPSKPKPKPIAPATNKEALKPYVPRHIPYADFLKMFNGITQLAIYWFNKQNMKE